MQQLHPTPSKVNFVRFIAAPSTLLHPNLIRKKGMETAYNWQVIMQKHLSYLGGFARSGGER